MKKVDDLGLKVFSFGLLINVREMIFTLRLKEKLKKLKM